MPLCDRCHRGYPADELGFGGKRCRDCIRTSYAMAAVTLVTLYAEEVVELPYGWATARMFDGLPFEWMCTHLHVSASEARTCLDATVAAERAGRAGPTDTGRAEEGPGVP